MGLKNNPHVTPASSPPIWEYISEFLDENMNDKAMMTISKQSTDPLNN
jgi:hypothetical protein